VSNGTSRRATSLNPLGTSRLCAGKPGICSWASALHLICSPGAVGSLLRASGWPFCRKSMAHRTVRPDSSKRVKDLAQSYGFRGIIAGTRKTTPGACMQRQA
jgi:hypothetical protein